MGGAIPQEITPNVLELLADPLDQEWQQAKKAIEQKNEETWSKACGLWGRMDPRPTILLKDKAAGTRLTPNHSVSSSRTMAPLELQMTVTKEDTTNTVSTLSTDRTAAQGEHSPDAIPITAKPMSVIAPRSSA